MGDYFYSEINMKCARRIHFTLLRYTSSWYGRFYIELTKNITYDNYPVIFVILSPFLENSNSR